MLNEETSPFYQCYPILKVFTLMSHLLDAGDIDAPVHAQPGFEPWSKVRPVLDAVNLAFNLTHFTPSQQLYIDEYMVGMKNRTYLQYMPIKRHLRFDIKKCELCDALNGCVIHVEIYAGKEARAILRAKQ